MLLLLLASLFLVLKCMFSSVFLVKASLEVCCNFLSVGYRKPCAYFWGSSRGEPAIRCGVLTFSTICHPTMGVEISFLSRVNQIIVFWIENLPWEARMAMYNLLSLGFQRQHFFSLRRAFFRFTSKIKGDGSTLLGSKMCLGGMDMRRITRLHQS